MDSPYQTRFSDVVLTSVFAGFVATLLCFVYYLTFKEVTEYPFSSLLNVSSLIFGVNTLFVTIGCIYYLFIHYFRRGEVMHIVFSALLTAVAIWAASTAHRSDNALFNTEFHQLLIGILLILGVMSTIVLPLMYHSKKFHESIL
jgi:hypothetical protein